ncbi:MAG: type III-A CRISPR-associated protein Cas10/Csm1 [Bacillota bacterium]
MEQREIYLTALLNPIRQFIENKTNENFSEVLTIVNEDSKSCLNFSNSIIEFFDSGLEAENELKVIIEAAQKLVTTGNSTKSDFDNDLPFQAVFANLFDSNKNSFYQPQPLDLESIFPVTEEEVDFNWGDMVSQFKDNLMEINEYEQLYYLLQKYFWGVSNQLGEKNSIFDYAKAQAAIAVSLFGQYQSGEVKLSELEIISNVDKEQFLLLCADVSGIQDFIFNVSSKGAAKSLKGRSVYVGLISEIIAQYTLDELGLNEANLLYNGGGNFYILAPASKKEQVKEVRKEILDKLLLAHDGQLYFAIDSITFNPQRFTDFSGLWNQVRSKVEKLKQKRWSELGLEDNFTKIFGPLDEGTGENDNCTVCGVANSQRDVKTQHSHKEEVGAEEELRLCTLCESFMDLTDQLKRAAYYYLTSESSPDEVNTYNDIFNLFGYNVELSTKAPAENHRGRVYKLNQTDIVNDYCTGYKFEAYNLPMNDYQQLTFQDLAAKSPKFQSESDDYGLGDKKLGLLKLDIDNLGAIFSEGIAGNKSITRVTALSRMLSFYFKGYINYLINNGSYQGQTGGYQDKIYVVFSGGDDTFIVGAWNAVFSFAKDFYDSFREYTSYHKDVTFSAGLGVYRPGYPIIRAADLTEDALDEAKGYTYEGEKVPSKNKISLFGEIFNWEEFEKIAEIKDFLVKLIVDKGESRAVLHKVRKSTLGFEKILDESTQQNIKNLRFWRLAYYLRDIEDEDAEKLIEYYREIVLHNLMKKNKNEKINNIMIIPAAVRWAELATKEVKLEEVKHNE